MLIVNLHNLRRGNSMLSMITITQIMVKEMIQQWLNLKPKLLNQIVCDYYDAHILVTGDVTATGGNGNTKVAFKNCAPLTKCLTHINDKHVDSAENLDIIMPMFNLIEYSDNYSDTWGSLWQFKRDESPVAGAGNPDNFSTNNSTSFMYKSSFLNP